MLYGCYQPQDQGHIDTLIIIGLHKSGTPGWTCKLYRIEFLICLFFSHQGFIGVLLSSTLIRNTSYILLAKLLTLL